MSEVLQRVAGVVPPLAVSAQGLMIRLADGREIIDGTGGAAVACIGHRNRKVRDAIAAQLDRVPYVHTMFFTVPATEELAHILVGHKPGGLAKAMFLTGGSEAMEAALKITRQYHLERGEPNRTRFVSRQLSYHGNTLGALGAGPDAARKGPFGPYVSDRFSSVSPAFAYHYHRADESEAAYVARLAAELDAEFERVGPETVAGFIAETIVGSTAGAVTSPPGYFRAIREVCDRHGALLVLDEVFCGMGRTGTMHAWEAEGISPDIQTIAKGLGAGYQPIAAILVHGRVADAIAAGSGVLMHGHTYTGHPVACAGALAVQQVMAEEGLVENARAMGERLFAALHERFGQHPFVGDVRGRGLLAAIELVEDREAKRPFPRSEQLTSRIRAAALERGLAVYTRFGTKDGTLGDHALLAPPYIAAAADIDRMVGILGDSVDAIVGR